MDIRRFFEYLNLREDPFSAEEARHDAVYQRIMKEAMTHPDFSKIYGSPQQPATAVVFGEKGSGKTAIRLLMEERYRAYNDGHPDEKVWVVRYDDLNPILERLSRHRSLKGKDYVAAVQLGDHQDGILALAVTALIDLLEADDRDRGGVRARRRSLRRMPRQKRVDLATLALLYDQPHSGNVQQRWAALIRLLGVGPALGGHGPLMAVVAGVAALVAGAVGWRTGSDPFWWMPAVAVGSSAVILGAWNALTAALACRGLERRIMRSIRAVERQPGFIRAALRSLRRGDLAVQPVPHPADQDSRYDLSQRLVRILNHLGYRGVVVIVDRVDEPVAVSGDPAKMRSIVWPLLNNKFLQQENFACKLLLPIELGYLLNRENADFFRAARMDKQNMIERLEWTGATLYDICTRRIQGCHGDGERRVGRMGEIFAADVTDVDLIDALDQMRQPRSAFRFLYEVVREHCQNTPDDQPTFTIPKLILEQVRKRHSQRVRDLQSGLVPA